MFRRDCRFKSLENDETLLVQSGKPVGIFKTHADAPRVLLANSNIVPAWATQENFDKWEKEGLIMYGQMTAGSWIYIGTQGILQGTYETLAALAQQHGWGSLRGKFVLTAGLGGMGGATWVSVHHGVGVGIGYSLHAGQVIVAEGTPEAAARLKRVLTTDPRHGRHPSRGCGVPRSDSVCEGARRKFPCPSNP